MGGRRGRGMTEVEGRRCKKRNKYKKEREKTKREGAKRRKGGERERIGVGGEGEGGDHVYSEGCGSLLL